MSDVMFFGVLRMPYEMAMADDLSRYQFYTRAQEAADRVEKAERELAERAVSPAESVDDPDEPNLRGLLHELVNAVGPKFDRTMNAIFGTFIAYGQKQLEHGRRSAMEELSKEKERADRAEAERDQLREQVTNLIQMPNVGADLPNTMADCAKCKAIGAAYKIGKESLVQPSDNLQQASTAQAEPAPVGCPDLGDAEEFAEMLAGHGGMLAQAIEMVDGCMDETMVEPEDAAAWQIVKKHIRPAQATPEGAELTPEIEAHECAEQEIWWNDWKAKNPLNARHSPATAALEAWIARAKIAVSQQDAERQPDGYAYRYPDGYIRHSNGREINGCEPIEAIPYFYRAAPPQQVAPMTPEMLRAVQLRSEVGTYITANWANAYECLQELWRVACEAQTKQQVVKPNADCSGDPTNCPDNEGYGCACSQPQQVDTGGLPG